MKTPKTIEISNVLLEFECLSTLLDPQVHAHKSLTLSKFYA
jgi:hypothetical protein